MATIVKRKEKYHVVYDYEDSAGERKQKWKAFTNRPDDEKFKVEIENKKMFGEFVIPDKQSVQEFMETWMELYSKGNWQYSQYSTVKGLLRNHVYPLIGEMQMQDVTPLHIAKLYNTLSTKPKFRAKNGECLSSTTIKYIHSTLKVAFAKAKEWMIIERTPVICTAPKPAKPESTIWSDNMFKIALQNIDNKILHLAVHLTFMCSLRAGEALGLTWDCVDLLNGTIKIKKTIQRAYKELIEDLPKDTLLKVFDTISPQAKTTLILKKPKTSSSVRMIYLSAPLIKELTERKKIIENMKEALGPEYIDNNLVFSFENGMPIEVKLCTKWFKNWQKVSNLGFPVLTFHEIRHSSSTYKLRISGGDTKSVQGDTGHAKADTLINTYSHIEDPRRMHLSHTIEEDFYGTPATPIVTATTDIVELIKSNPEMRQKALAALVGEFS